MMRSFIAPNRMALPPPPSHVADSGRHRAHRDIGTVATALITRAKVVLTALALTAAVVLVAAGSWPLKILAVLAFVRGVFASDLVAFRNVPRRRSLAPLRPAETSPVPQDEAAA